MVSRLPRLPKGPAPAAIPARARAARVSSFPILPAAAASLILLGAAQLGLWWMDARLPEASGTARSGNPFVALPRVLDDMQQSSAPAVQARGSVQDVQRLSVMPLPQNIQFGDAMGMVTVTIFTDPACGTCRDEVRRLTATLPVRGVRQVYKFWPQDATRLTPGLLVELARRGGVIGPFWRSLQGAGNETLTDERMLTMLDAAGVPLATQRTALTDEGRELAMSLEPDIAQAREARLPPPPVFVVDDMVLDGQLLNPRFLGEYVTKRLEGRQIFEANDLFLMRK